MPLHISYQFPEPQNYLVISITGSLSTSDLTSDGTSSVVGDIKNINIDDKILNLLSNGNIVEKFTYQSISGDMFPTSGTNLDATYPSFQNSGGPFGINQTEKYFYVSDDYSSGDYISLTMSFNYLQYDDLMLSTSSWTGSWTNDGASEIFSVNIMTSEETTTTSTTTEETTTTTTTEEPTTSTTTEEPTTTTTTEEPTTSTTTEEPTTTTTTEEPTTTTTTEEPTTSTTTEIPYLEFTLLNTNAQVYANGASGSQDPVSSRGGWYFINDTAGEKINWYFFDGTTYSITVADISAFAVVELDSTTSRPWLSVLTKPTGTGDFFPGFFKSSKIYTWPVGSTTGVKYLIYFGQEPTILPELPRIQLTPGTTQGSFLSTEEVFTVVLHSDSGASVNSVQFIAEKLGINTPSIKGIITLEIDDPTTTTTTTEEPTTSTTTEEPTTSTTTEEPTTSTTTEEPTTTTTTEEPTTSTTTEEPTTTTTTEEPTTTTTTEEPTTTTTTEEPTTSTTTEEPTTSTTTEEPTTTTTTEEPTTSTTTEEPTTSTTTEEPTTTTTTEEPTTSTTTEEPTTTTTTEEPTTSTTTEEPTTTTTTEEPTTSTTTEEPTTSTTTVEPIGCIYYFSDAGSSNEINDGGDDMYDDANLLYADSQQIAYTHTQLEDDQEEQLYYNFTYDGVVFSGASSSYFGEGSSYFTNLYPGLFVLAARDVNIETFSIEGNIGADGSGEVDSYNFQSDHSSGVHQTFVKRVWDAGDPSINHIIIVNAPTASTITQIVPNDTEDDTHIISGLQSQTVSNIYYLLSAKRDGVRITNTEISGMVTSFLNISASSSSVSDLLINLNTRFSEITGVLNSDCHEIYTTTTTTEEPTTSTTTEEPTTSTTTEEPTTSTTTEEPTTSTTTEEPTTSTTTEEPTTSTTTVQPTTTTSTTTIPDYDILLYFDTEDQILFEENYYIPIKISYRDGVPVPLGALSIQFFYDLDLVFFGQDISDIFSDAVTNNILDDSGKNLFIFSAYTSNPSGFLIPDNETLFRVLIDPIAVGQKSLFFNTIDNEITDTNANPYFVWQNSSELQVVEEIVTTTTSTTTSTPGTTTTSTTTSTPGTTTTSTTTSTPGTTTTSTTTSTPGTTTTSTTTASPSPTTTTTTTTTTTSTTTLAVVIPEVTGSNTGSSSKFSSVSSSRPSFRVSTPPRRRTGRFSR